MCSSELTLGEMVTLAAKMQTDLEESQLVYEEIDDEIVSENPKDENVTRDLHAVAKYMKYVRMKIKNKEKQMKVTDIVSEIGMSYDHASAVIPNDLYHLLAWLITDNNSSLESENRVILNTKNHDKVLNIAQDLIATATAIPTPKHIGLALHIFRQTRSKELVTTLNRYGHCISYTEAQRYISTIAENIEQKIEQDGIFIPQDLRPESFIQCGPITHHHYWKMTAVNM